MTRTAAQSYSPELQQTLVRLRAKFAETLYLYGAEIDRLSPGLARAGEADKAARRISEIVHKIRGVARTLGYDELGELAGRIEDLIDRPPLRLHLALAPLIAALLRGIERTRVEA